MSDPKEQEKLTQTSRKSYDGGRTPMAESDKDFDVEEPHDGDETDSQDDAEDEKKEKATKERNSQERSKLAGILRALFATNEETNDGQKDAVVSAFVKFVAADTEPGDLKHQERAKNVANLLLIFATPEKLTPHASSEDLTEADISIDLFDTILDAAEEVGIHREVLSEELATIAEDLPPIQEGDRFERLEEYIKDTIDKASDHALKVLKDEMAALGHIAEAGSEVHQGLTGAESLLEDILEEVEIQHNTTDDLDTQELTFDKEFATVLVSVFEKVAQASLKEHFPTEESSITDLEEQESEQLMDILLSPKDSRAKKRKLFAAMLESVEGNNDQETVAIREKLMRYAEHAGFDPQEIAIEQAGIAVEFPIEEPAGNALESVPTLNAFEQMVQQQITDASSKEVRSIQRVWEKLLETAEPGSITEEQATDAIDILGKIIELKKMQEARERGETVNPHLLEPPGKRGGEQADHEPEIIAEIRKDGEDQEQFVKAMRELVNLVTATPQLQAGEAEFIQILLDVIANPNQGSLALNRKKIAELVSVLSLQNNDIPATVSRKVQKELLTRIEDKGIKREKLIETLAAVDGEATFERFEQLIKEGIESATVDEANSLQALFSAVVTITDSDTPFHLQAEEALSLLRRIVEAKEATGKETALANEDLDKDEIVKKRAEQNERELALLKKSIDSFDDADLQAHLRELVNQLEEGMSVTAMEKALQEITTRATSVAQHMRKAAMKKYHTGVKDKRSLSIAGEELIDFENSMYHFKKFLIREISAEETEETKAEVPQLQRRRAQKLVTEARSINERELVAGLDLPGLDRYMENLEATLAVPGSLTAGQLAEVYEALMTQHAIVRDKAARSHNLFEYAYTLQKVKTLQADLYKQLLKTDSSVVGSVEDHIGEVIATKAKLVAVHVGDMFYGQGTGAYTPVDEGMADDRRYGPIPVQIGDAVERLQHVDPTAILPSGEAPEGLGEEYESVRRSIGRLQQKEVYSKDEALEDIQRQMAMLQQQLANRFDSDRANQFANVEEAKALALAIHEQRRGLAALTKYKGTIDRRRELDGAIYDGYIHEALGERIRRIRVHLGQEQSRPGERSYSPDEVLAYYRELRKWAKTILANDIRNNAGKTNQRDMLRLSTERYQRYKQIVDADITSVPRNGQDMLQSINYLLNEGEFLRYFMKNVPDPRGPRTIPGDPQERHYTAENPDPYNPDNLLGISYQRPEELQEGYGIPEAVKETMNLIADKYSTKTYDFHTGGNRELIDAEGNFKYNNFYYWIRVQVNADIDYNKDGQINPFGKITIKLPLGSISLYELLLLIPEYLSQREFEIKRHDGKDNEVYGGWGEKTEHPDFKWLDVQYIAAEMEFRQLVHDNRIKFVSTSKSGDSKTYLALMHELHDSNHWTRANNILLWLGMPSSVTNGTKEIDDWVDGKKEKQGSLGKALSDMLLGYYYLPEVTDFFKKPNKEEKTFNENMFYKFWEPNGANKFLTTMAEQSLNHNNQAKAHYARFIQSRIMDAAQVYSERSGLTAEQRAKIQQLMEVQATKLSDLANSDNATMGINISFTSSEHLTDFFNLVESEVFNNPRPDADLIARKVRDDLLKNLKTEYFQRLYDMQIGKVGKQSSDHYLMVNGTTRFGDIVLDNGMTMRDFLNGFDAAQVTAFDYKTGHWEGGAFGSDPLEVRRRQLGRELTASEARATLDDFMAAGGRNHELFKRNEQMMLAFTKHVTRMNRSEINHLGDADESEIARDMVRESFRRCVEMTYGIDSEESMYAWTWARDYTYIWGIAAMNDVTGIGFRTDGKLFRTGKWRARRGGKDGGGNKHTYDEFLAVSLPFLHALRVVDKEGYQPLGHQSAFSLLQGGEGKNITPRAMRDYGRRQRYTIALNAEEQYVTNTLTSGVELVELLSQTEFDFSGILKTTELGQVSFDYEKARELFKKWRKPIRYALEKNHIDYREVIWANGRETDLYHHFFGKKTRALNELIKRQTGRSVEELFKKPADAVMMSIIAAEIAEHRAMFTHGHHWSIQNIMELERFLIYIMTEDSVEQNEHGIDVHKHGKQLITHEIFTGALKAYHFSYHSMYSTELATTFFGGLWAGILDGIKEYFKGTTIRI